MFGVAGVRGRRVRGSLPQLATVPQLILVVLNYVILFKAEYPSLGLGVEIATAATSCQRGVIRNKTEASACEELPNMPNAPENSHVFTFRGPSPRI